MRATAADRTRAPLDTPLPGDLHRRAFAYFERHRNPVNGLVRDCSRPGAPASIAVVGMALGAYPVAVERGWIGRTTAAARVLDALRFLHDAPQGPGARATGHRGFYYHFLDVETGRRAWRSELSTIDTALLLAGALLAARYFDGDAVAEAELRERAEALYRRCRWDWAVDAPDGGPATALRHGWRPGRGFIPWRWEGYTEALLLYVLALGSPTHPAPPASYAASTDGYRWRELYGVEHLWAGPLFIHQLPHAWLDLRGVRDAYMAERGMDYFENSRRAVLVQRAYATRNTAGFPGYGPDAWGLTASHGPGPALRAVDGRARRFWGYRARGVPFGPDDGTLSAAGVAACLPFAPELAVPALEHLHRLHPGGWPEDGVPGGVNPAWPDGGGAPGEPPRPAWVSDTRFGLDQGAVVLLVENARSGLPWRLARSCPHLERGMRRAGFTGGWLDGDAAGGCEGERPG